MAPSQNYSKHGLSIRGDSYYCPLSFSLDSYWNCELECANCYLRRLNRIWGKELRPTNSLALEKKLINGLKNPNPKSSLAWALKNKKTIRFGNKTDPFQPAEKEHKISKSLMKVLLNLNWSFVIQTKNTKTLSDYSSIIEEGNKKELIWIMPIISPGLEKDWEMFENKKTTNPIDRLNHMKLFKQGGVNGEPFIPGYHTIKQFNETLKLLKSHGIKSYNTYNLHLNDLVAKNFADLGLDIEKIWTMNKDKHWKPILHKLLRISEKYDIVIGCPDFVNSGWKWGEQANTCCGINVPNPTTFNTHHWKKIVQTSKTSSEIDREWKNTWDGIGNFKIGQSILNGSNSELYTMKDIK